MLRSAWIFCSVLTCVNLCLTSLARATLFPLRENPNVEVIYLENPSVDLAIRNKLISEAKHSVDLVSFSHTSDEVGIAIVRSLRTALARGVKVRTAFDVVGNRVEGDTSRDTSRLLADSTLPHQAEVVGATPFQKLNNWLFIDDFIHEKILIIDAGTPDAKIIIGGRNHGNFLHDFGDSAYLLRPIDPDKAWAGTDVEKFYEQLWGSLRTMFKKESPAPPPSQALKKLESFVEPELRTDDQKTQFKTIERLLSTRPGQADHLEDFQFRPGTFQFASNDLLMNASMNKAGFGVGKRSHLPNDILTLLHSEVTQANSILLSGYAVGLPEPIASDVMRHAQNGKELQFVTNGREAFQSMTRPNTPSRWLVNSAADYTLRNLIPLMEIGEKNSGNVSAYFLRAMKSGNTAPGEDVPEAYKYLHRKLLIMDDTVATGSDNWTESSARKNDEIVVVMKDSRMSKYLRGQVNRETRAFYDRYSSKDAKAELANRHWISKSYSNCLQMYIRQAF